MRWSPAFDDDDDPLAPPSITENASNIAPYMHKYTTKWRNWSKDNTTSLPALLVLFEDAAKAIASALLPAADSLNARPQHAL